MGRPELRRLTSAAILELLPGMDPIAANRAHSVLADRRDRSIEAATGRRVYLGMGAGR